MPTITATKLRENTPDSTVFRLPGDSAMVRHQLTRDRKLAVYGSTFPTTKGTVKVVRDIQILDPTGKVSRTQPCLVELTVSIPNGTAEAQFNEVLQEATSTALSQAAILFSGYLPGDNFSLTVA